LVENILSFSVIAKLGQTVVHVLQLLHKFWSIVTLYGVILASIGGIAPNGQIVLQKNLFFVSSGKIRRKTMPMTIYVMVCKSKAGEFGLSIESVILKGQAQRQNEGSTYLKEIKVKKINNAIWNSLNFVVFDSVMIGFFSIWDTESSTPPKKHIQLQKPPPFTSIVRSHSIPRLNVPYLNQVPFDKARN
jgi:hypothetical protein